MKDKIVYSSESGDLRIKNKKKKSTSKIPPGIKKDGFVRIRKENKGRGGKTVSIIYGIPLSGNELTLFAKKLKQKLGTGGTVKNGVIIIQGDKTAAITEIIIAKGFKVK